MNREKHSEKVLSVRVSNKLYEGLLEVAKERDTTVSELTRQSLIMVYLRALVGVPEIKLEKNGLDIENLLESEEGIGSAIEEVRKELKKNKEYYQGYIERFLKLVGRIEENEKAILEVEKKALGELKHKYIVMKKHNVLLVTENETRLEGSSVSSSRGWGGAPHREQAKESA